MKTNTVCNLENVPLIDCPDQVLDGHSVVRFLKKTGKMLYNALTFDAEPIFESKDWPYLWKTK